MNWAVLLSCVFLVGISTTVNSSKLENSQYKQLKNNYNLLSDEIDYRLPATLKPESYNLYLHPDIEAGTFTGQETIRVRVLEATQQIILHSNKLNVGSVYVSGYEVEGYEFDEVRQFLIINMDRELTKGTSISLSLIFDGQMLGKLTGLYSSSYMTPEQERKNIATTKFEPTYARQAFPCFDEPAMKAEFNITVIHPTDGGYHALSNMDQERSENHGAYTEAGFSNSVPMSTYLACIIVSNFVSKDTIVDAQGYGEDFTIRIFATPHQVDKVDFAVETAKAAIEYYLTKFKVPYPLPKLDMAAIPDFASNAMEHWGLVTYRETALLYDENISSTWNKQRVGAVIAHELAHMWFGNLVTMQYWDDIWLNEGFARFMEYSCLNAVYPDWGMKEQFLLHALHTVMKFDSLVASHPIRQSVKTPDQITEMFDTISYEKGASVIRMLEDAVGADTFAQGVTNYLKAYQYGNAVTDDFVKELEKIGLDFDISLFMRTWTEQMGLPVIEVQRTSRTQFYLTQKRFFSNIEDYDKEYNDSEFGYKWDIPLTYQTDIDRSIAKRWFYRTDSNMGISVPSETKWLKLNMHQIGFYRVNYDEQSWRDILDSLITQPDQFDIADRAHLLNDIFALADAGQLAYDIAMEITKYLPKETEFVPWYVAASKLQDLNSILRPTDIYTKYLKFSRNLLEEKYKQFTWNSMEGNHQLRRLRVSIFTAACVHGLPACLNEAANQFNNWLNNPEQRPDPDLREVVYYYGMQTIGDEAAWERMWQVFVKEHDAGEKNKLMYGLAGIQQPWMLNRFIMLAADDTYVRSQDYYTCMQNIASNPMGEPIVWDYVRQNWQQIVERFGLNDRSLGRMIPSITSRFASETRLSEMQYFFAKYPEAGAGTESRKQAIETVKANVKWLELNKDALHSWLDQSRLV